jgi:hypothetical protein
MLSKSLTLVDLWVFWSVCFYWKTARETLLHRKFYWFKKKENYLQSKLNETTLSVQIDEITKLRSFILPEPVSLEVGLLKKTQLPSKEGGVAPIKDEVISLFPNLPAAQDKNFHEVLVIEFKPGLHHRMELLSKPPVNFKVIPTFQAKRAWEERWKVVSSVWAEQSTQL